MLLVDEIEALIDSLVLSSEVLNVSFDGTDSTITVENSYHARFKMVIGIDGSNYQIISSDQPNNQFVVAGDLTGAQLVTFPKLFYFHGTAYATNSHINRLKSSDKVPMCYLHEIIRKKDKGRNGSTVAAPIRLFFLDQAKKKDWTTDDHYSMVITGMNRVVEAFKDHLFDSFRVVSNDTEYTTVDHVNFGEFRDLKGHVQSIFDDYLSGVELSFEIIFRKCCNN
jgi:hypothetical protein